MLCIVEADRTLLTFTPWNLIAVLRDDKTLLKSNFLHFKTSFWIVLPDCVGTGHSIVYTCVYLGNYCVQITLLYLLNLFRVILELICNTQSFAFLSSHYTAVP